jgi:hypothetical protein
VLTVYDALDVEKDEPFDSSGPRRRQDVPADPGSVIMDARFEKTWLILVSRGCLYILLVGSGSFRCLPG